VKDAFRATKFYQSGAVWRNERRANLREDVDTLRDYMPGTEFSFPTLLSGRVIETAAFGGGRERDTGAGLQGSRRFAVPDLGVDLVRFAMDANPFFAFSELSHHFPNLPNRNAFITSEAYLAGIGVTVRGSEDRLSALTTDDKVAIARFVIETVERAVKSASVDHVGTREFTFDMLHTVLTDREIKIGATGESGRSWSETELQGLDHIDLHQEDWHVFETSYGTDQEKYLIRFIHDNRDLLRARFDEFYLIRNEKMVTRVRTRSGLIART
jgi:type III restriction enzyme